MPGSGHSQHKHGDCPEVNMGEFVCGGINIAINLMFLWGSVLFLESSMNTWYALGSNCYLVGDWLFIIASVMCLGMSLKGLWATMDEKGEFRERLNDRVERNEIFESALFVVAATVFLIGSIIFCPLIPYAAENKVWWEAAGAWLFIAGSFCFVLAGFFNGYGKAQKDNTITDHARESHIFLLKKYGLLCVVCGSVMFVVGSYLYRPGFHKGCDTEAANVGEAGQATGTNGGICADSMNVGTWQYIYGSILFCIDAFFQMAVLIVRHEEHVHGDEINDEERRENVAIKVGETTDGDMLDDTQG